MTSSKSRIQTQISESQIRSLGLPVGSKVLLELTNPRLENFIDGLGKELGYLTITSDGYTLKIDSDDKEITEAYEYLQERINEGSRLKFAPPSDKPVFYIWQSSDWKYNAKKILTISLN
jgi:hypothetical protein